MDIDVKSGRWLARACCVTGLVLSSYGLAVYLSGAEGVWHALTRIGSGALVVGLSATVASLVVRAGRWQWIFMSLGHRLPLLLQLRVYFSGLALSSTPGKAGETIRSLLLRPHGVRYAESLAAFVCDRLSDVVGIAVLGAAIAALSGSRAPILEGIATATLAASMALAALFRSKAGGLLLARAQGRMAAVLSPASTWAQLWRGRVLGSSICAALLAYGIQGLIFAGFAQQLQTGLGWGTCVVIFVNATLIGAASMVPGGLGTMDAAMVIQLRSAGVPAADALAAAIATRVCTLWFAWTLGISALLTFSRSAGRA